MSADLVVANYLRIASEDLDGARALAVTNNRNAVYLCEQSAEKIIRAVLTSEGVHANNKHHLDEMVDLVPDHNPIKPLLRAIESLAAYATTYRYPTATRIKDAPEPTDLARFMADVAAALHFAVTRFGVDLTGRTGGAATPDPIRYV